jgi:hypothetical protein
MSKLLNNPTPTVNDLAKKYGVSSVEVRKQLMHGIKVEKEHTNNPKIAREIALDHLGEKLDYYKKLSKIEEESTSYGVRGLGYYSGDPAGTNFVQQYIDTNSMSYEDENGNKFAWIKKAHLDLHNSGLGYNFFNPKEIETTSNRALHEQGIGLSQYSKLNELGGMTGYEGTNDLRAMRKDVQVEGEKLKKAKRIAMAGMTAANIYTMGDVMSKASSGHGSPKGDVVRMASTFPGAAGWGATGVHYAKKAYDLVKGKRHMKEDKDPCWKGYEMVGMKKKGGKKVPNCVPVSEQGSSATRYTERPTYEENKYPDTAERGIYQQEGYALIGHPFDRFGDVNRRAKFYGSKPKPTTTKNDEKDDTYKGSKQGGTNVNKVKPVKEDWQSVNRKDKTDGLSQKAVDAYKRENPGSKLQTAVTEKNPTGKRASRRKSFCSRMGGMKKRLTSAKTARDPDSRINKALRRWNCEEETQINELKAETLGSYTKKAAASRKKSLEGPKPDIKTWSKREHGIRTAIKKLTSEAVSQDKDWNENVPFREDANINKPDTIKEPGAMGTTKTVYEETKMENKLINEAIENIMEDNLGAMKENLMVALQEKAIEKLEERKKEIAANYFVKD